jgi:microcystin-dependent protein
MFSNSNPTVAMSNQFLGGTGGSQPHDNFEPYLCINFIISLFGIYPSQT